MKKLNATIYNKLFAQAEEAKHQGLNSLASSIFEAIGPHANDERSEYTYKQLQEDIHRDMWKIATRLMHYYDVNSLDAEKLDETLTTQAELLVEAVESTMQVDEVVVGPLEPEVPGQDK